MTETSFVFAGCRIVKRVEPLAQGDMTSYRGVFRLELTGNYLDPRDASRPTGWLAEAGRRLRQVEDTLELIPDPEEAMAVWRAVQRHDFSYELIGCSIDESVLQHLIAPAEGDVLSGFLLHPIEAAGVQRVHERLSGRPPEPDWRVLGYDVASFGNFISAIFEDLQTEGAEELRVFREQLTKRDCFRPPSRRRGSGNSMHSTRSRIGGPCSSFSCTLFLYPRRISK